MAERVQQRELEAQQVQHELYFTVDSLWLNYCMPINPLTGIIPISRASRVQLVEAKYVKHESFYKVRQEGNYKL